MEKRESIRYYCIDLLWGQKLYQELRFVLVEMNGVQGILASTSLELIRCPSSGSTATGSGLNVHSAN